MKLQKEGASSATTFLAMLMRRSSPRKSIFCSLKERKLRRKLKKVAKKWKWGEYDGIFKRSFGIYNEGKSLKELLFYGF
jgi:hypothetical protein